MLLTQRLAEFVIDTDIREIPAQVITGARNALLDTVGCALAGNLDPVTDIAAAWARETGAKGQATVWGRNLKTSPAEAAFVNGVASHALDFDDSLPSLRGHPSTTMVPAALAVGETVGASGEAVLAAFSVGLEVAGCLGRAVGHGHYARGWHTTATVGAFATTAIAARLWQLSPMQLQMAWGLTASQVSGLVRNFGTMTKPFHAGHAARTGVMSVWMAKQGLTADASIFDGKNNFFSTYGGHDGAPLVEVIERLGNPWEMVEPSIYVKSWPCCYCNHRPIGGILHLLEEHHIQTEEVEAIEVGFLPGSDTALISNNPKTGLEGKFSIEYVAAATVSDRKLTVETFTDEMVNRPEVRALMEKVRRYRIEDSNTYSGVVGYTDVAITTKRGIFSTRVDRTPGSPAWPMSDAGYKEKFLSNASRVLGADNAKHLLDLIVKCQTLQQINLLVDATVLR